MLCGMPDRFTVRVAVRSYEVDMNGHLNHAFYHRYGEHARAEHLAAAGCSMERMVQTGTGLVLLETHARFLRELRYRDEVEIDSRITFGDGKVFAIDHTIVRLADAVVAAEITCTMGLIDAEARRLVPARERLLAMAKRPDLLGFDRPA